MTVLVLAAERDPTADGMVRHLAERGIRVVRLDTAWFPAHVQLAARCHSGEWVGSLRVHDRVADLGELRSVWYRSPTAFTFPPELTATERHWAGTEAKLGLGGVLSALPLLWINHPARVADAAAKPLQLTVAARCGLQVPDTLVTNDVAAVRRFASTDATIAKAFGAVAVVEAGGRATAFTRLLDAADLADLRGVGVTLHQVQRWVPKACEARVVVVGDRVFAAGIHAGTPETHIDWRASYHDLAYSRITVPEPVCDGVVAYCRHFGLVYGAFDFVIGPDEHWTFLECNAGGQYGWIENAVSAPITAALAELLTAGTHVAERPRQSEFSGAAPS